MRREARKTKGNDRGACSESVFLVKKFSDSYIISVENFKLYNRAIHVYSEARRVEEFQEICNTAPPGATDKLGQLMNDSHASCSNQYECSCPELDSLVDLCV